VVKGWELEVTTVKILPGVLNSDDHEKLNLQGFKNLEGLANI